MRKTLLASLSANTIAKVILVQLNCIRDLSMFMHVSCASQFTNLGRVELSSFAKGVYNTSLAR